MLDWLINTDIKAFLLINGCHSPAWDQVMWWVSGKLIWLPLYLAIAGYVIYRYKWNALIVIILALLLVTLSDQVSVHLFKEVIIRLRPCHNPDIMQIVHLVNGHCGGLYGFVSSHASNSFALAFFTSMVIRNKYYIIGIFFWAALVSYSRIYLGVHYPGDVLGGAVLGIILAYVFYELYIIIDRKPSRN